MKNITTLAGTCVCRNDQFLTFDPSSLDISSIVGYSAEEIESQFHNQFINLIIHEDREVVLTNLKLQVESDDVLELTFRVHHKKGESIWVFFKCQPFTAEDECVYFSGILLDITKSKTLQNETEKLFHRYQIILSQTENIVFEYDPPTDQLYLSDTWEKIFGYKPSTDNFFGTLYQVSHVHQDDKPILEYHIGLILKGSDYQSLEARIQKLDGSYIWTCIRATALHDENGNISKLVGIIINIDADKKARNSLQKRAERDSLTKLLNNETARIQSEAFLTLSESPVCSLFIIDLDNFKQINDQFGHMQGDKFLKRTAEELQKLFRSDDIVARIGGDEFMILVKNSASVSLVHRRCLKLVEILHSLYKEFSDSINSSCSIGVAFSPEHGTTYSELFQHADAALYRAKSLGKSGYAIYDENID